MQQQLPSGMIETEFPKFIYNYGGDHMITEYVRYLCFKRN